MMTLILGQMVVYKLKNWINGVPNFRSNGRVQIKKLN